MKYVAMLFDKNNDTTFVFRFASDTSEQAKARLEASYPKEEGYESSLLVSEEFFNNGVLRLTLFDRDTKERCYWDGVSFWTPNPNQAKYYLGLNFESIKIPPHPKNYNEILVWQFIPLR